MSKILIIEDEEAIADLEKDYLELSGFTVEVANDGDIGLQKALNEDYDLLILYVMLPGTDGFDICRQVRDVKNTPIVMVSAKKDDIDKIRGLGLGADDYMTKPFGMMELIARVKALLRRTKEPEKDDGNTLNIGCLSVIPSKYSVKVGGEKVVLTLKEFDLLCLLLQNKGTVFTRDKLLNKIWGYDFDGESRTVDVHVRTLRQKLGEAGKYIETVRGIGYKIGD